MKQVKSIFLTAVAAFAFAACNNDEITEPGNPGEVISGKETYVSFNFKVAGAQTNSRAAMETDKGKDEDTPAAGRILIFDDASGALLNNEPLQTGGMTIKTTSGVRRIYVIMGTGDTGKPLPANISQMNDRLDKLKTSGNQISTLSDFYALMTDDKYTTGDDTDMGKGFKELMTTGQYVMSNVADISAVKTLHPGIGKDQSATGGTEGTGNEDETVNRFMFNVFRAVAKGRLQVHLKKEDAMLETADKVFQLKEGATYGVRNVNRSTYYVQRFLNDKVQADIHDHDSESGLLPFAAFHNVFDESTPNQLKDLDTYNPFYFKGYPISGNEAQQITMTYGATTPDVKPAVYFSENSNSKQLRGNTTYYGIATQVNKILKKDIAGSIHFDGTTQQVTSEMAAADYDNTTGNESFWYVRELPSNVDAMLKGEKRRVFTNQTVAFTAVSIILKYAILTPAIALETTGFTDKTYTPENLMASYNQAVNPQGGSGVTALTPHDVNLVDRFLGYYKNGMSYYRLNLYETTRETFTERHLVRRNHNYVATVTSFATIGDPTEGDLDKDPEKPVDADVTNVTAIIKVAQWHDIIMEDDL